MIKLVISWRLLIAVIAISIVSGTIIYSKYLAQKIKAEEKLRVEQWYRAGKFILSAPDSVDISFATQIVTENQTIPIIQTNEKDSIIDYRNIDTAGHENVREFLKRKLLELKSQNPPIVDTLNGNQVNRYYYGHTRLLNEVRYYPLIQLLIVALFILITIISLQSRYRAMQNQLWVGMAKETAHQLGTPVSSLEGWLEVLKEKNIDRTIIHELEKDIHRLQLISDRFGKIGSVPQLEESDIVKQVKNVVEYMKKRSTDKVFFEIHTGEKSEIKARISPPLFDWVIENLLKNALDAIEGKGKITIHISDLSDMVIIDVTDNGKGISKKNISNVFKPGFTTKKRGWGLGLSLSRRIISDFHKGEIFVKNSEPGKGTTIRIKLFK